MSKDERQKRGGFVSVGDLALDLPDVLLPARRDRRRQARHFTQLDQHGPATVEDAATAALDLGVPTYRFLRRYLDRRPAAPLSLRQVDPLIRQLTLYRDLIDRPCRAAGPSTAGW